MKAIAINGSPKMDGGNTALVLNPFLEGMKEAGAEVEVLYTSALARKDPSLLSRSDPPAS